MLRRKTKDICAPADDGGGVTDAVTHEDAYQLKLTTKPTPHKNIAVTDHFGTLHVDATKPDRLLVPTGKGLGTIPQPPVAGAQDHYECYKIKITSGTTPFAKGTQATVTDQFQTRIYDVKKPKYLCTPVDKNGEGIVHPLTHLMCYQVKHAKGQDKTMKIVGVIFTGNQFGLDQVDLLKEDLLCVPATTSP